jgi:hypothetical protein
MALSSLPTELVEHIAEHLDLQSFRAFRLSNAGLSRQSVHVFKEQFLRKRTVRWDTPGSLWQLEWMTSHPPFGGVLEHLVVDATPRFAIRLWELKKSIDDADNQPDFVKRDELKNTYIEVEERSEEVAKYWSETRQDLIILTSVFKRLQHLSSITFAYDGMDKRYDLFGRRYCENSQNEMSRPFVTALAALAASQLDVQCIGVDPERRYGAISIGRLESISPVLAKFDPSFPALSRLQLSLRDWRHPDEGFELPAGKVSFIVRFLSRFQNVETLELSCFSSLEGDIFSEIATHCVFPHLKSCKLGLFRIHAVDDIFDFLEPSKASLRTLSLSHTVLRDETTQWDQVLRRIASRYALDRAEFRNLFTRLGACVGFSGLMRPGLVLEGDRLRQQLMQEADNLVSGGLGPAYFKAAVAYPFIGARI